jgi:hypothetical protein
VVRENKQKERKRVSNKNVPETKTPVRPRIRVRSTSIFCFCTKIELIAHLLDSHQLLQAIMFAQLCRRVSQRSLSTAAPRDEAFQELITRIQQAKRENPPSEVDGYLEQVSSWVSSLQHAPALDHVDYSTATSTVEGWIDRMEDRLPPLKNFILPVRVETCLNLCVWNINRFRLIGWWFGLGALARCSCS